LGKIKIFHPQKHSISYGYALYVILYLLFLDNPVSSEQTAKDCKLF